MLFDNNKPIAIIDSGIGGLCLCKYIIENFQSENVIYFADNEYMPYGNKSKKALYLRLKEICDNLINNYGVKAIIFACNTASTVALEQLKKELNIDLYGVNPNLNESENTLIISTKLTSKMLNVSNCIGINNLANCVEDNFFDKKKIIKIITNLDKKYNFKKFKNIVLGCTHYELISKCFLEVFPEINFICPSKELIKTLKNENFLKNGKSKGCVYLMCSLNNKSYIDKLYLILTKYI